jgi:8-oxo-dGTP pyrophosphatase MutT (NUDIX family)
VKPAEVAAAGGLVTRPGAGGGIEIVLVHRPKYDDWTFPKGKLEAGESDEEAAVREVCEETGFACTLGEELATVRYVDARGRRKRVRYWIMTIVGGDATVPNAEVDDLRWLSPEDATRLLTYAHDQALARQLGVTR